MAKEKIKGRIVREILLPDGVGASVNERVLIIKGPKGEVKRELKQHRVSIKRDDKKIILESEKETKRDKKIIGSLAAHVKNMIRGSLQNHTHILKICSGHFPMSVTVSGDKLIVKNFLGEKVPRVLKLNMDSGAEIRVEGELIYVKSASKEIVGQVSADIEQLTRRPGYDTRIFQDGIYIINKGGRELK